MDERIPRGLTRVNDFEGLAQLEKNARKLVNFDEGTIAAFKRRAEELARSEIANHLELNLSELRPVEERIVQVASEYLAIKRREGSHATRTLDQLRDQGLIEAVEISVCKARPTQGFETLRDANRNDISYEKIVVDYPEEFSHRALWYARRTLGHANETDAPPALRSTKTQIRTEQLLAWLAERAAQGAGRIGPFSNGAAALAVGMADMARHGRDFGNIQSRLDFACYRLGLPPLGLTAEAPFKDAWKPEGHDWQFPVSGMQVAARNFRWQAHDFDRLIAETEKLPGRAYILWRKELADKESLVRAWAEGLESGVRESTPPEGGGGRHAVVPRNPDWTREEIILGLDLYMRLRGTSYPKEHPEVIKLSETLRRLAQLREVSGTTTFRNANSISMKMLNFRRLDPEHASAGLRSGSQLEVQVWDEFVGEPEKLAEAVDAILYDIEMGEAASNDDARDAGQYWVLVCNPAKWAIDEFLASNVAFDTWAVRLSDAPKFAPGQLALLRVGVDRRSAAKRNGRNSLEPGIYAVCEIETASFPGTGDNDDHWAEGEGRKPGWPMVKIRYLRNYLERPLGIQRLKSECPQLSPRLLNGLQAATFPISATDFHSVLELLGENVETIAGAADDVDASTLSRLAELETKFVNASPEVKTRVSKGIERGPISSEVKRVNKYRCQLCEALGRDPIGFRKRNGDPYIEAHHVMPVHRKEIGSLSATNIVTLCANHHREVHYGQVSVAVEEQAFTFTISGKSVRVARVVLAGSSEISNSVSRSS